MKYLLIDANNLSIRHAFANSALKNSYGIPTAIHYGVFNSLVSFKQSYPDYQILFAWDGKSIRRKIESEIGVKNGLIKSAYKANREKEEYPQPLLDFYSQSPYLKKGIEQAGIPQIRLSDYETDDVIASYCKKLKKDNEIICISSDQDYLQLLDKNVEIFDGMKNKLITHESFEEEYKIKPKQWIDVGSLSGDSGDNIFGISGWGDKTALEAIQEHQSWENLYKFYHTEYGALRTKFPDLTKPEDFKKLTDITTKSGKQKYPEIIIGMPYSGLVLAVEEKRTKNISKNILIALMFEERVKLAYSLKKMDDNIDNLPEIKQGEFNEKRLLEYFSYYEIHSLVDSVSVFK